MTLTSDLQKFRSKTEEKMERAARTIVLKAFSECIQMSPVHTGRFKGNWQTSTTAIPSGVLETTDPSGAIARGKVEAAVATMELGDVVHMANNLPYARRLEDGWSKQAPAGMVKLTVQRWQPIANEIIARIGAE